LGPVKENHCFGEKREMAKGIIILDRFYWNVDQHVGVGGANKVEDVQLVQLGYFGMAALKASEVPAEMIAAASKIQPGETYTGKPDESLSVAIRMHQKLRGGVQDGVISPVQNTSGHYTPQLFWMIISLQQNLADSMAASWPHLDKHPKCPTQLSAIARKTFQRLGKD
jgi:hypothetical protein